MCKDSNLHPPSTAVQLITASKGDEFDERCGINLGIWSQWLYHEYCVLCKYAINVAVTWNAWSTSAVYTSHVLRKPYHQNSVADSLTMPLIVVWTPKVWLIHRRHAIQVQGWTAIDYIVSILYIWLPTEKHCRISVLKFQNIAFFLYSQIKCTVARMRQSKASSQLQLCLLHYLWKINNNWRWLTMHSCTACN